jgi:NADH-quinone oxidoreductase subunit H
MLESLFQALVFPGFLAAFIAGFLYEGIVRKIAAHTHHRIGPPVWQPFMDWVKLMFKENIRPKEGIGFLMTLSPIVSFASLLTVILFIPIAGSVLFSFQGSLFVVIYFLILYSAFFAIAGFATGNPFGYVGGIREITQIVSYEFPFIVSLLTVGFLTGFEIVPFLSLQFPFAFLAFMAGVLGKLCLPPFHIPEAEQEIVSGHLTEYSGPRLAMFELSKAIGFWVLISLGAVYFLGAQNMITFIVNSLVLLVLLIIIRTIFARLRISQAFRIYWFVIGPLAVIDLVRVIIGFY